MEIRRPPAPLRPRRTCFLTVFSDLPAILFRCSRTLYKSAPLEYEQQVCSGDRSGLPRGFHVNTHSTEHDGEVVIAAVEYVLLLYKRSLP